MTVIEIVDSRDARNEAREKFRSTAERYSKQLALLPDNSDKVAGYFQAFGSHMKGVPTPEGHPLAKWLTSTMYDLSSTKVTAFAGHVEVTRDDFQASILLPTAVGAFVSRFNRGQFPELRNDDDC